MRKYNYFEVLTSTNDYLKENYKNLPNLSMVVAGHQTKGRGRLSRQWLDDSKSILLSILIKPKKNIKVNLIPLVVSVAVHKFFKKYCFSGDIKIKWPNDILLKGKKAAGILVESKYIGFFEYVIVGIGINVNNENFEDVLEDKATSLFMCNKQKYDLKSMYDELIECFYNEYCLFEKNNFDFIEYNRKESAIINEFVFLEINGAVKKVKVLNILDDGGIKVEFDDKIMSFTSGEITLQKNYDKR